MRRKALIVLLALGTVGGYASGFASLRWRHCQRRDAFEPHVAQVCVDAARRDEAAAQRQQAPAYNGVPVIVQVNPAAPQAPNAAPAAPPAPAQNP
jgi:hypothetical protein